MSSNNDSSINTSNTLFEALHDEGCLRSVSYAARALQNAIANGAEQDEFVASESVNGEVKEVEPKEDDVKEGTS